MSEPFLGEIRMISFNFAPKGWAMCAGQLMPINQNQALFSLLGTMYGGNGQINFALPDLRGRTPLHVGGWADTQGMKVGATSHTLTLNEMPQHTHVAVANSGAPTTNTPGPALRLSNTSSGDMYAPFGNAQAMAPGLLSNVGGSQPHENMMPYTVVGFCIALQGIFPYRN